MAAWLRHFPRDQLRVMQYERLINNVTMPGELTGIKGFLGIDRHLPSDELPLSNWKHLRGPPDAVR